jgi:hypothetical protein
MNEALAKSNPQPSLAVWPKVQDQIEQTVQRVILGKDSPAEGAAAMVKILDTNLTGS